MDFKIRVLRFFVTIAEQGSVTKAAETLRVAQPSLSQRIRSFEDQLGFPLFERSHGAIHLSAEGAIFLPIARKLVEASDLAGLTAKNIRDGELGKLVIGGSFFNLDRPICKGIIDTYTDQFSDVDVVVERGLYSPDMLKRLKNGKLDAAFVTGHVDGDYFKSLALPPVSFDFLVPTESPLAKMEAISLSALSGLTIAWYRRENNPYVYDSVAGLIGMHNATITSPPDTQSNALIHFAERNRVLTLVRRGTHAHNDSMKTVPLETDMFQFQSSLTLLADSKNALVESFFSTAVDALRSRQSSDSEAQ